MTVCDTSQIIIKLSSAHKHTILKMIFYVRKHAVTMYCIMQSLCTASCSHCVLHHAVTVYCIMQSLCTASCSHYVLHHAVTMYCIMQSLCTASCSHYVLHHAVTMYCIMQSLCTASCSHYVLHHAVTNTIIGVHKHTIHKPFLCNLLSCPKTHRTQSLWHVL